MSADFSGEYEPSPAQWVRDQVAAYEASGGREANTLRDTGLPVVIVTMRGNKSGKLRKIALMRVEHDGEYALVARRAARPKHPVWYYNLVADPHVTLQDGPEPCRHDGARRDGRRAGAVVGPRRGGLPAVRRVPDARPTAQIPVFVATPAWDGQLGRPQQVPRDLQLTEVLGQLLVDVQQDPALALAERGRRVLRVDRPARRRVPVSVDEVRAEPGPAPAPWRPGRPPGRWPRTRPAGPARSAGPATLSPPQYLHARRSSGSPSRTASWPPAGPAACWPGRRRGRSRSRSSGPGPGRRTRASIGHSSAAASAGQWTARGQPCASAHPGRPMS